MTEDQEHPLWERTTAIGETYAAAILPLAQARGEAEAVTEELEKIAALLDGIEEFDVWAMHPGIPVGERIQALEQAFRGHVSDLTCDFLLVICRHGRLGRLDEIAAALRKKLEEAQGKVRVHVIAARKLEEQDQRQLEKVLNQRLGKIPLLTIDVRPEIIGGLIVEAQDQRLDFSIRRQLEKLRMSLDEQAHQVAMTAAPQA